MVYDKRYINLDGSQIAGFLLTQNIYLSFLDFRFICLLLGSCQLLLSKPNFAELNRQQTILSQVSSASGVRWMDRIRNKCKCDEFLILSVRKKPS